MENISEKEARDQLPELIQTATVEKRQYRITSEQGSVVLLPEETYENILVTLELLSTPGLLDNLKEIQGIDEEEEAELLSHMSAH